jgi:hypothetical protein
MEFLLGPLAIHWSLVAAAGGVGGKRQAQVQGKGAPQKLTDHNLEFSQRAAASASAHPPGRYKTFSLFFLSGLFSCFLAAAA